MMRSLHFAALTLAPDPRSNFAIVRLMMSSDSWLMPIKAVSSAT